jgi:hypothetical protein
MKMESLFSIYNMSSVNLINKFEAIKWHFILLFCKLSQQMDLHMIKKDIYHLKLVYHSKIQQ